MAEQAVSPAAAPTVNEQRRASDALRLQRDVEYLTAEIASLRDQLARETALRIAAEQRAEAMAW